MPIYKDKKRGTWYVKRSAKDPITGKYNQVMKRGFSTKREASLWEAEYQTAPKVQTTITFREMDEKYIAFKNARKESTREQERSRVNKYVAFADVPMAKITKGMLISWYTDLIKMDMSTSVKNYCISVVKGVFKYAHECYDLPNDAAVLKKLKRDAKKDEMTTWVPEEFDQFISEVPWKHYNNIFTFMYWTGCRRGEALALRKKDYHDGMIRIHHQIKYEQDGFMELKTDSSERTLTLIAPLRARIDEITAMIGEDDYLFGFEHPLPITNLQRYFTKGIKASGVKKIRIHDLRHSFATNAIANGVNIVALSKYLGHSTIQQTLETYVHALEKTDDELVQIMGNLQKTK